MKAKNLSEAKTLLDLPNVGPATARDLIRLGIRRPLDLKGREPRQLYDELCHLSGVRQDPCVFDVFAAAIDFVEGAPARPWWHYSSRRKKARISL